MNVWNNFMKNCPTFPVVSLRSQNINHHLYTKIWMNICTYFEHNLLHIYWTKDDSNNSCGEIKICFMLNSLDPNMQNLNYKFFYYPFHFYSTNSQYVLYIHSGKDFSFWLSSYVMATLKIVQAINWGLGHKLSNIFFNFCGKMSGCQHWTMYLNNSVLILY
jgi:hypothetical protein